MFHLLYSPTLQCSVWPAWYVHVLDFHAPIELNLQPRWSQAPSWPTGGYVFSFSLPQIPNSVSSPSTTSAKSTQWKASTSSPPPKWPYTHSRVVHKSAQSKRPRPSITPPTAPTSQTPTRDVLSPTRALGRRMAMRSRRMGAVCGLQSWRKLEFRECRPLVVFYFFLSCTRHVLVT